MAEPADPSAGSLRELAGRLLGRDAVAADRARLALDDYVASGKLTREDADSLLDELRVSPGPAQRLGGRASDTLSGIADQLGLVRERRVEELDLRIAQLEHRIRLLESAADADAGTSSPGP